jgi:transcriptional regulator with XRE-family HTH domain
MENIFSINLRRILGERKLNQNYIADILDVSQGFVSKMLNGVQEWSQGQMELIANDLHVPLWEFFTHGFENEIDSIDKILTRENKEKYIRRARSAEIIRAKYSNFDEITDSYFNIFLNSDPETVKKMVSDILYLDGKTEKTKKEPVKEKRKGVG